MFENCDTVMHLGFNFDACPMNSPFRFMHLKHQNLSVRALFCHNSLTIVNTQLLIYNNHCWKNSNFHPRRSNLHNGISTIPFQIPKLSFKYNFPRNYLPKFISSNHDYNQHFPFGLSSEDTSSTYITMTITENESTAQSMPLPYHPQKLRPTTRDTPPFSWQMWSFQTPVLHLLTTLFPYWETRKQFPSQYYIGTWTRH